MSAYLRFSNSMTIGFLAMVLRHFGTVIGLYGFAPSSQSDMFIRLAVIIGATIGASFLGALVMQTRQGAPLLPDEREEKIERISEGAGVLTIYAGLLVLAWLAFAPLNPIQVVNGILLVVAATELIKLIVVLFLHRREVV